MTLETIQNIKPVDGHLAIEILFPEYDKVITIIDIAPHQKIAKN